MPEKQDTEQAEAVRLICEALSRHGAGALGGRAAAEVARGWIDAGFDDAEEVDDWLRARCFEAERAQALEAAGFTPEQAALRTKAGTAGYEDTIAYKLNHNDLSFDEARRIITSEFWNS